LEIAISYYFLFVRCRKFDAYERVKAGLDVARSKGRTGGRPRALTPDKLKTLRLLTKTKELSVTKICQIVGITRSVYYRATNEELL
jgi:DNA invertase Pin-like site-specific DNA recombinase